MAVKIRLMRFGKKKTPYYRIVVSDERNPRDGRYIEKIGIYHPLSSQFKIDETKLNEWLKKGAQLTESVKNLIKSKKLSKVE